MRYRIIYTIAWVTSAIGMDLKLQGYNRLYIGSFGLNRRISIQSMDWAIRNSTEVFPNYFKTIMKLL